MKKPNLLAATVLMILALVPPGAAIAEERADAPMQRTGFVPAFPDAWVADRTREGLHCLALNIYWEARSEPMRGQIAVAAVVLNRVRDSRYPDSICEVVQQGGAEQLHRCQFSWWCDGKADIPQDHEAWGRARTLARLVHSGAIADPTHGSLWYHADYVTPNWSKAKRLSATIATHHFYADPPTATQLASTATENRARPSVSN